MCSPTQFDVLIIGSGAAGLTAALHLPQDLSIGLVSKTHLGAGASAWAQGGVAAVVDLDDSIEAHIQDTLDAGAGLCQQDRVAQIISKGQQAMQWLIDQGVPFTTEGEQLHLTREGGHSARRVLHAADATGKAIVNTLLQRVIERSNVHIIERHISVDLISSRKLGLRQQQVLGAYLLNCDSGKVQAVRARSVILATGGASKVYLYTSNPDGASGDGIAMAWRAGCRVANMEFNQFHPTCLYHPHAKSALISEAVRGEGGQLKLPDGNRFMHKFDSRLELAPRDIVARAIDHEMKRLGADCLYLDIRHKGEDFIKSHFPTIHQTCLGYGIDICNQPIPVVPAAHYTCGGIVVDEHGRTDIDGLYAIGECSHTGLHGANRLASNSLLECVVYGQVAAEHIIQSPSPWLDIEIPEWDDSQVTDSDEDVIIAHNWDEVRRFMWDYVGIVRTDKRLERAKHRLSMLKKEVQEYYSNYKISANLIELRNLLVVAELMIDCALKRKESRGLHYSLDYPEKLAESRDTILIPGA